MHHSLDDLRLLTLPHYAALNDWFGPLDVDELDAIGESRELTDPALAETYFGG